MVVSGGGAMEGNEWREARHVKRLVLTAV